MNNILKGVADFITAGDTLSKFKIITYSEYVDDLIKENKMPAVDILGFRERKTPLPGFSFDKAYRQSFDITIIIIQDAKLLRDILHGTNSVWGLSTYLWNIIETDRTFGGIVRAIDDKPVESKLVKLTKDNSVKLGLETELTLTKDVFK
ncbi:MAG: hypothetical protein CVV49_08840 [Spirochaetae bacterium HGW-Spirochaetae-5]|nr:MAG: hypothetical protein CVV49_08840 [Spirochaetae bacterium HGW-Spirochaetae-5]